MSREHEATITFPLAALSQTVTGAAHITGTAPGTHVVFMNGGLQITPENDCVARYVDGQPVQRFGHIMSDPEVVSHCPFCGSGLIILGGDQTISCDFCNRSFLVMEQPQFNAMPADPNAVPPAGGLPGSADPAMPGDPAAPGDPTDPNAPADGSAPAPAPHNPQTDPDELAKAPPFKLGKLGAWSDRDPDESAQVPCDRFEAPDGSGMCKNCGWAIGAHSAKAGGPDGHGGFGAYRAVFKTAKGWALNEDDFVRHLAHLHDHQYMTR